MYPERSRPSRRMASRREARLARGRGVEARGAERDLPEPRDPGAERAGEAPGGIVAEVADESRAATRPWTFAVVASGIQTGRPSSRWWAVAQSPAAQMPPTVVRPAAVDRDRAAVPQRAPRPRGDLRVRRDAGAQEDQVERPARGRRWSRPGGPSRSAMRSRVAPARAGTPASSSAETTGAATSPSSAGSTRGADSTICSRAPRAMSASAISRPIGPLPTRRTLGSGERREHGPAGAAPRRRSRSVTTPGRSTPGNRRAHRPGARGDDERPVGHVAAVRAAHRARLGVDGDGLHARPDLDPAPAEEVLGGVVHQLPGVGDLPGDEVRDPAGRVGDVRAALEHHDLAGGVGPARLGGGRHAGGVAADDRRREPPGWAAAGMAGAAPGARR